ncbi:hypothetical protein L2E82_47337 [Cichorium intybus]|uniref:Uncharacterized protein n=1 Tax=Cichorium intybus TaxID=13427 RepID=A0ACB8YW88_CICIN|nr:hypothetical protein L2E82_47337 [Cichorium intybus]
MAARRSVFERMGSTGQNGGKVTEIRAKEITGWVPDFLINDTVLNENVDAEGEDDVFLNHDGLDYAKDGISDNDDGEYVHVPDLFDNDKREGVKNTLDDDPFGLHDLISKKGDVNSCCSKETTNDIPFPPGFTPPFVAREETVQVECQDTPNQDHSPLNVPSPNKIGPQES